MDSSEQTKEPSAFDEASWNSARRQSAYLHPLPPSIVTAIQTLWQNQASGDPGGAIEISAASQAALRRVDRTSKLRLPIAHAAEILFPERYDELKKIDPKSALIGTLGPGLYAALLALVYAHRRLKKLCTAAEWETLSKEYILNMELGYIVGTCLPKVGPGCGALLGGIRYAALATFLLRSSDQYSRYRNKKKGQFDLDDEYSRWNCNHAQVAAYLLRDLGLTKDVFQAGTAIAKDPQNGPVLSPESLVWWAALHWIDGVKSGKCPALDSIYSKSLAISGNELAGLQEKTSLLFEKGSTFAFMLRSDATEVRDEEPPEG